MWNGNAVFDDEIAVWWDYVNLKENGGSYCAYIDGTLAGTVSVTHYEFTGLEPDTEYCVKVELCSPTGDILSVIIDASFRTAKQKRKIDVSSAPYFAVGDGKTDCTGAIQRAIDDCRADECVYIPAGVFFTGALTLHGNMELYVSEGAVVKGSDCYSAYLPKIKSRFEGTEMDCYASLLNLGERDAHGAFNCENVIIRGGGCISGGGAALRISEIEHERELLKDYLAGIDVAAMHIDNDTTIPGRARGRLIHAANCRNITLCHLTLENAPAWNLHFIYSEKILTYAVTVNSIGISNGDGWDPDSSSDCVLFGSVFNTGDNAVAIKSGKNPDGNRVNIPSEHIRVFDVTSHRGGGLTVGSEMSGGVSDVRFWDCDSRGCMPGLQLKGTPKRGGYIRDVKISNCRSSTLWVSSTLSYGNDGDDSGLPVFEDFVFEDIEVDGREYHDGIVEKERCLVLTGFDADGHRLRNVLLKNVVLLPSLDGEPQIVYIQHVEGVRFENFTAL